MNKVILLFNLLLFSLLTTLSAGENQDYERYHQRVIDAEKLIGSEHYSDALQIYEELFNDYDFVFLREYKIASQLALYLNDKQKAREYLKNGMLSGWKMKSIKRNKYLERLREGEEWKAIKKEYRTLNKQYQSKLNHQLQKQVKKMLSKDQWKAFRVFLTFSSKGQDRCAERKFAPHSEKQMAELSDILKTYGYPGERLIGNSSMSTILSHHNSISKAYVSQDQLYPNLKPKLKEALKKGQISPHNFALIDDWYLSVKHDRSEAAYGIIDPPSGSELPKTNQLRSAVFLRSVEIRNRLIDIQEKTGMNFYLEGYPWINGKIEVR